MLALPNAPEAEPTGPCPWRPTQEIVELQSLNGGFTGNPSVILLKTSHDGPQPAGPIQRVALGICKTAWPWK